MGVPKHVLGVAIMPWLSDGPSWTHARTLARPSSVSSSSSFQPPLRCALAGSILPFVGRRATLFGVRAFAPRLDGVRSTSDERQAPATRVCASVTRYGGCCLLAPLPHATTYTCYRQDSHGCDERGRNALLGLAGNLGGGRRAASTQLDSCWACREQTDSLMNQTRALCRTGLVSPSLPSCRRCFCDFGASAACFSRRGSPRVSLTPWRAVARG
jgi:hypothetical protein